MAALVIVSFGLWRRVCRPAGKPHPTLFATVEISDETGHWCQSPDWSDTRLGGRYLDKVLPDMNKFKPFTYNPEIRTYFAIVEYLGKTFSIGKEIR